MTVELAIETVLPIAAKLQNLRWASLHILKPRMAKSFARRESLSRVETCKLPNQISQVRIDVLPQIQRLPTILGIESVFYHREYLYPRAVPKIFQERHDAFFVGEERYLTLDDMRQYFFALAYFLLSDVEDHPLEDGIETLRGLDISSIDPVKTAAV